MKFTKIKWDGKRVELAWTDKTVAGTETEHVMKSYGQPSPMFRAVFTNFARIVIDFLELPESWLDEMRVTGLSINEEEGDGRAGLVITSQKKVIGANSPIVLNTPHLREAVKGEESESDGFMTDDMMSAVESAWTVAARYLNGEREQIGLFDEKEKDPKPDYEIVLL